MMNNNYEACTSHYGSNYIYKHFTFSRDGFKTIHVHRIHRVGESYYLIYITRAF